MPFELNPSFICSKLSGQCTVLCLPSVDSTNNEAKRLIREGKTENLLIVSDLQTSGRGRQGKAFFSPAGTGLYMTVAFSTPSSAASVVSVTSRAAVAVRRVLCEQTGLPYGIKWVNDIYLHGKKVCGILAEAIQSREDGKLHLVIGVGINIQTACFPGDLPIAGSIGIDLDRNILAARITDEVLSITRDFEDLSYLSEYRAHSVILGHDVRFSENGITFEGRAVQITDSTALVVEMPGGEKRLLQSGEISVRALE